MKVKLISVYVSVKKRGDPGREISVYIFAKIREKHDLVRLCHEFYFCPYFRWKMKDLQKTRVLPLPLNPAY